MIESLDRVLRQLLLNGIPKLVGNTHVRFQPPDKDWRAYVGNLDGVALNIYLVEIRENRVLFSNERSRTFENGGVIETPAPRRIDCHYLLSAWSPVSATAAIEPTLEEEHVLLYDVCRVLMTAEPLIPRKAFEPLPLPASFPLALADAELPTQILPGEGFPKYAEFWGTMGPPAPWRPAIYLRVTLPVLLDPVAAGPMVTTATASYGTTTDVGATGDWIEIGGTVRDSATLLPDGTAAPVPDAWVELQSPAGIRLRLLSSDPAGHFAFRRLRPGKYRLRTQAQGFPIIQRDIDVPSPTGEYDLQF